MTKEEYAKALQKYYDDNKLKNTDSYGEGYTDGLAEALDYAIGLAEKLDEPEKVVIPQFVADWIEKAKVYYGDEVNLLGIVYWIRNYCADIESHYEWLKNIDNQKLLLNAIVNGYEVEKETKYQILLPGFQTDKGDPYVVARTNKGSWYAVADLKWDNTKFTSEELKQAPEWVQQLKPEEVEN